MARRGSRLRLRQVHQAVGFGVGEADAVAAVCEEAAPGRIVEPVNYNAPGQVVIAGHADAVRDALERARGAGAKRVVELPVSVPAHSSLMKDASDELAAAFAEVTFGEARIPVVHNVDAATHSDPAEIRDVLRRQLYNPVRWTESVSALKAAGAEYLVELGPGKVLTGLARRIDRQLSACAVEDPSTLERALETCKGGQGT